ncbi:MAG: hypothetical protein GX605_06435, partial [Chloroflexi bacterium]|nr:hypothetical protein [Chloroflexota bacterium]
MFHRGTYENARPDGVALLEVVGSALALVPLRRTELRGELAGPLAALQVTHTFGYSRAQCKEVLEAVYRFPLPGDAAVTGVRVRFGDVEIVASLHEREKAKGTYDEAKQAGEQAALLTRESPDVFTLQVAGIRPDEEIAVETSYVQLARAEGVGWSLRLPLTTAPRYVRSDEFTSRHAQSQPLALLRDPGHRFDLDLRLLGAASAASRTHALAIVQKDGALRLRLQDGEALPDRDLVLTWQPQQQAQRPTLQVLLHQDKPTGDLYFLALLAPPAGDVRPASPREVILLVDHSGSMTGPKWEAADWAVKGFLYRLQPTDAFALGLFHNSTRWFDQAPRPAAEAVEAGAAFLERHKDSGGTELGVALEQALALPLAPGAAARHVLVVT